MKRIAAILFFVFLVLAFVNCQKPEIEGEPTLVLTEKAARLVETSNQFGLELFQNITNFEKEAENLMVSPLSVALALAMTYNGAETTTKTAMEKTLRLSGLTTLEINQSFQSLTEGLQSLDTKVLLEMANAIFYRQNFQVETDFVTVNKSFYNAEVSALDFSSPSALQTINDWVARKTHTKIPKIIDEISPGHVMFLLNAIWFKGTWSKEFNSQGTSKQLFTTGSGNLVNVDMMRRTDTLGYMANSLFSAIRLPYGKGKFNMYVFLPAIGKTPADITGQMDQENWKNWMGLFKTTETVDIMLPKFKFAYEIKLNEVLSDMGMAVAFGGGADFTGINRGGGLFIDYVKHKTFVDVNEEGTEAAAVTVVAIRESLGGQAATLFHVNRPFLFAITEKDTGAILFIGTVNKPVYE